jgi:hypothetical protein
MTTNISTNNNIKPPLPPPSQRQHQPLNPRARAARWAAGDPGLTSARRLLRADFYVGANALNLVFKKGAVAFARWAPLFSNWSPRGQVRARAYLSRCACATVFACDVASECTNTKKRKKVERRHQQRASRSSPETCLEDGVRVVGGRGGGRGGRRNKTASLWPFFVA